MDKKDKIQVLYSIRNTIFNEIDRMSVVPDKVQRIIREGFQELNKYYEDLGVSYSEIEDYIEGNYNETMANISNRSQNDRRGEYWGQINLFFDKLEDKINNEEEINKSDVERFKIDDDSNQIALTIAGELEEKLKDVKNRHNELMSTRGYSDNKIEEINYNVSTVIGKYMEEKKLEIADKYKKREKQLTKSVIEKVTNNIRLFNNYIDISSVNDFLKELENLNKEVDIVLQELNKISPEQDSAKPDFKDRINVTEQLPYGKQRANSRNYVKESEKDEEQQSTDDDILPDLFE